MENLESNPFTSLAAFKEQNQTKGTCEIKLNENIEIVRKIAEYSNNVEIFTREEKKIISSALKIFNDEMGIKDMGKELDDVLLRLINYKEPNGPIDRITKFVKSITKKISNNKLESEINYNLKRQIDQSKKNIEEILKNQKELRKAEELNKILEKNKKDKFSNESDNKLESETNDKLKYQINESKINNESKIDVVKSLSNEKKLNELNKILEEKEKDKAGNESDPKILLNAVGQFQKTPVKSISRDKIQKFNNNDKEFEKLISSNLININVIKLSREMKHGSITSVDISIVNFTDTLISRSEKFIQNKPKKITDDQANSIKSIIEDILRFEYFNYISIEENKLKSLIDIYVKLGSGEENTLRELHTKNSQTCNNKEYIPDNNNKYISDLKEKNMFVEKEEDAFDKLKKDPKLSFVVWTISDQEHAVLIRGEKHFYRIPFNENLEKKIEMYLDNINEKYILNLKEKNMFVADQAKGLERFKGDPTLPFVVWKSSQTQCYEVRIRGQENPYLIPFNENLEEKIISFINEKYISDLKEKNMFVDKRQDSKARLEEQPTLPFVVWKNSTGEGYGVQIRGQENLYLIPFNENLEEKIISFINEKYISDLKEKNMFVEEKEKGLDKLKKDPKLSFVVWTISDQEHAVLIRGKKHFYRIPFNENLEKKIEMYLDNINEKYILNLKEKNMFVADQAKGLERFKGDPTLPFVVWKSSQTQCYEVCIPGQENPYLIPFNENLEEKIISFINENYISDLKEKNMFVDKRQDSKARLEEQPTLPFVVWKNSTGEGYGVQIRDEKIPHLILFNENLKEKIKEKIESIKI